MQNRVKYVLRTTLASGGLLMLGTGAASAAENGDLDLPATPVDQLATADQDSLRPAIATDPLDAGSGTRMTAANTETLLRK
ncbi:hypothetical protein [Amycolatopsis sp. lyj-90]|uniref:hypothetical protein n=1 Tax=Amycolatopsis sp. lyj-90 TaxID=2789285 RepID=UPI00397AFC89